MKQNTKVYAAIGFDALFLVLHAMLLTLQFGSQPRINLVTQLLLPAALLPLYSYLCFIFFGQTFGQWIFGIELVSKNRSKRIYDWIFETKTQLSPTTKFSSTESILMSFGLLIVTMGVITLQASSDLEIRFWKIKTIEFEEVSTPDNHIAPFYYAVGAWPKTWNQKPVYLSIPYEKGPPTKFLGKIVMDWDQRTSKITLTGPLTLKSFTTRAELKDCFIHLGRCIKARTELTQKTFKPFLEQARFLDGFWFEVKNDSLPADERPQGFYIFGDTPRGQHIHSYFVVQSKMAVQGILLTLDPLSTTYETDTQRFKKMIGSMRVTADLQAHRLWVNQWIAQTQLAKKPDFEQIRESAYKLVSKMSVEPSAFDAFYHWAGLGILQFREAIKVQRFDLSARAKVMVDTAVLFAKDVKSDHPKIQEMETFAAEIQKGTSPQ